MKNKKLEDEDTLSTVETDVLSTRDSEDVSINELYERLGSSESGLSNDDAKMRLEKYGINEITEKKANPIVKFLRYFWGPIPFMIELAIVLSIVVSHWEDVAIITLMLLMNAVVGFWQEHKADDAIEKLKSKLSPTARVLRDNQWIKIDAKELVPGDIIRIRAGDTIPADVKLIAGDYVSVDQSALTGESLPVDKEKGDIAYQGSNVKMGEMQCLVLNTGMNSYFGQTAKLMESAQSQSHFEKIILKIGNYLITVAAILAVTVLINGVLRGDSILETVTFVLVLVVAAIPVALPAVLSVTMAVGALALAKKEAIVRKLSAIEEMAGVDILCSDKTGTITENKLTVGEIVTYDSNTEEDVLLYGLLSSREENNDPIDDAIIHKARSVVSSDKISQWTVEEFKPFDPVAKRTEATLTSSEQSIKASKGAPQVIAKLVNDSKEYLDTIEDDIIAFARRGFRAMGIARTDSTGKWIMLGLLSLYDPPRTDSAKTIKTAENMGINVKMITGDHIAIGQETAKNVGLGTNFILPNTFDGLNDEEIAEKAEAADGFAEVFPEHKYTIVCVLEEKGHIVGMTGDGVNDAPALKKADVGIAVAGATDVAKSAADIVLTKPSLSVIVDAIRQSRMIFQRMSNYAIYRIAETIRVLLFITASILIFQFYPVTAVMIVLLALLNDLPIMTIAYDNTRHSKKPERWNAKMLLGIATYLGIIGVFSSFGIFWIGDQILHLSRPILQSFIYLKLSVAGHLTLLVARTRGPFWSVRPAKILIGAILGTQFIATLITVYGFLLPAMGWVLALFVWGYAILLFLVTDALKVLFYKKGGLELFEEDKMEE